MGQNKLPKWANLECQNHLRDLFALRRKIEQVRSVSERKSGNRRKVESEGSESRCEKLRTSPTSNCRDCLKDSANRAVARVEITGGIIWMRTQGESVPE